MPAELPQPANRPAYFGVGNFGLPILSTVDACQLNTATRVVNARHWCNQNFLAVNFLYRNFLKCGALLSFDLFSPDFPQPFPQQAFAATLRHFRGKNNPGNKSSHCSVLMRFVSPEVGLRNADSARRNRPAPGF